MPASLPPLEAATDAASRAEALVRHTRAVRADWEDVDLIGHVNNVNAVGWCVAQHDFEFLSQWRPEMLEVNFLAEMFCGESFLVVREERAAVVGRRTFDYLIVREPDQTPTVRLRVTYSRDAQKSG
jgi:acyl-CoA thioesterase FadM